MISHTNNFHLLLKHSIFQLNIFDTTRIKGLKNTRNTGNWYVLSRAKYNALQSPLLSSLIIFSALKYLPLIPATFLLKTTSMFEKSTNNSISSEFQITKTRQELKQLTIFLQFLLSICFGCYHLIYRYIAPRAYCLPKAFDLC